MNDERGYIQFLAEARSGGQAAMGRLAVLVWERLYPFVLRTTQDRDAAEDIIQETLLTMLRRLGSLRDGERFWPWIYRIAWSRIQDRVRDRRLASRHETTVRRRTRADNYGSGDTDPLEAQARAETLQQVSAAIARLDHQQRDILRLRCYEDLPYAEIAARTRTSPEKVRVRFHRAKKSLQARLACCAISS
jgi:RNA polymerase sigma-70 factor (ECF subfamily)